MSLPVASHSVLFHIAHPDMDPHRVAAMSMFMAQGDTMSLPHKSPSPLSMDVRTMRLSTPAGPTPSPTSAGCSSAGCRSTLATHAHPPPSMPVTSSAMTLSQNDSHATPLCILPSSSSFVQVGTRQSHATPTAMLGTDGVRRSSPLEMTPPTRQSVVAMPRSLVENFGDTAYVSAGRSGTSNKTYYLLKPASYPASGHHNRSNNNRNPNNSGKHVIGSNERLFYPLHATPPTSNAAQTATAAAAAMEECARAGMMTHHANMFDEDDYAHSEDARVGSGETGAKATCSAGHRNNIDRDRDYTCTQHHMQQQGNCHPTARVSNHHSSHIGATLHNCNTNNSHTQLFGMCSAHCTDINVKMNVYYDTKSSIAAAVAVESAIVAPSAEPMCSASLSPSRRANAAQACCRASDIPMNTTNPFYARDSATHLHQSDHTRDSHAMNGWNDNDIKHLYTFFNSSNNANDMGVVLRQRCDRQHVDACAPSDHATALHHAPLSVTYNTVHSAPHARSLPTTPPIPPPPTQRQLQRRRLDTRKSYVARSHIVTPTHANTHAQAHPHTLCIAGSSSSNNKNQNNDNGNLAQDNHDTTTVQYDDKVTTGPGSSRCTGGAETSELTVTTSKLHFSDRCGVIVSEYDSTTHHLLAQYRCGALLGSGGYAQVYEFVERHSGTRYACKVLDRARLNPAAEARVRREVAIHGTLHHPHIVHLHRWFSDADYFYILLERCARRNLKDVAGERGSFTPREIQRIMWQLASAVAYMHEQCVIHRDIKLGNIMIDASGCGVKIGDFGFACRLGMSSERRVRMCGTPNYIAPEILRSQETREGYSMAVDVWSLGVVMFILACGYAPFQSHDADSTYRRVRARRFAFPVPRHAVSEGCRALIRAMLQPQPARRCTAAALLQSAFFRDPCVWPSHAAVGGAPMMSSHTSSFSSSFSAAAAVVVADKDKDREGTRRVSSRRGCSRGSTITSTTARAVTRASEGEEGVLQRHEEEEEESAWTCAAPHSALPPPPPIRVHRLVYYAKYGFGFYLGGCALSRSTRPPGEGSTDTNKNSSSNNNTIGNACPSSRSRSRSSSGMAHTTSKPRTIRRYSGEVGASMAGCVCGDGAAVDDGTPEPLLSVLLNDKTKLIYDEARDRVYYFVRRPRALTGGAHAEGEEGSASVVAHTGSTVTAVGHTYCDELHVYNRASERLIPKQQSPQRQELPPQQNGPTSSACAMSLATRDSRSPAGTAEHDLMVAGADTTPDPYVGGAAKKLAIARCLQPYLQKAIQSDWIPCIESNLRHLRTPHDTPNVDEAESGCHDARATTAVVSHTSMRDAATGMHGNVNNDGGTGASMGDGVNSCGVDYVKEAVMEWPMCYDEDGKELIAEVHPSAAPRGRVRGLSGHTRSTRSAHSPRHGSNSSHGSKSKFSTKRHTSNEETQNMCDRSVMAEDDDANSPVQEQQHRRSISLRGHGITHKRTHHREGASVVMTRRRSHGSSGAEEARRGKGGACVSAFAVRLSNHSFQVTLQFTKECPVCYHPLYGRESFVSAGFPWSMDVSMYDEGRRAMFSLACESSLLYLAVGSVSRDVHMCEDGSCVFTVWSTTSDRRTRLHLPTALLNLVAWMLAKLRCPISVLTGARM